MYFKFFEQKIKSTLVNDEFKDDLLQVLNNFIKFLEKEFVINMFFNFFKKCIIMNNTESEVNYRRLDGIISGIKKIILKNNFKSKK